MTRKRGAAVEKVDASQMMPNTYENWLKKQQSGEVRARAGFIGEQAIGIDARRENGANSAETVREKAKRSKRGKSAR
ncbi:MAG: hypothetical protein JRN09_04320 [Nitrososphaerota archaeon]|nr:hypothetical protein [Nitrososphaerota archaeon]